MFTKLLAINQRPKPFQYYTAPELWTNAHTSQKMLEYHLNEFVDAASRNIHFIDSSVAWVVDHFHINRNSSIIDFGCGPGLYCSRFARTGAQVTGIDFSERSLDYAKKEARNNNLNINYVRADYLAFNSSEKYDLITMIMCDFAALSPWQRQKLLKTFFGLLKPNGAILLDVYSWRYFEERQEAAGYELNQLDKFWSPHDYYCFVNTFKYDPEKLILDKYTIIEKDTERTVYNWFQCFNKESIQLELAANGLQVTEFYANVAGKNYDETANEFAIVARKME